HPAFAWYEQEFDLAALRSAQAQIKVFPIVTLSGRVLDPAGAPIAGAEVVLGDETAIFSPRAETRTDKDGKFSFPRLRPERRALGVLAEAWAPTVRQLDASFSEIDVRLEKGNPLRVIAQDN